MKLTEAKLKEMILEVLEGESLLGGLIKSGQWPMINQALSLTVGFGEPLEVLPWHLLPKRAIENMTDEELVEFAKYLQDNNLVIPGDYPDMPETDPRYLMDLGLGKMINKPPGWEWYRGYVEIAIKRTLGQSWL